MATEVMKVEAESETCCVCGGGAGGDLIAPEEYDAAAPPLSPPLRSVLARLAGGGVTLAPDGRLCTPCLQRALEAHEFTAALRARAPPPLSDKIRALRRRLADLTQKIDVFIVVGGGSNAAGGARAYSEEDIIMVERGALAAAAEPAHARNARGDQVYQCSVCPFSFPTAAEYRAHVATHPPDALHSCWQCGAQFPSREALHDHTADAHPTAITQCYLCNTKFQSVLELKRHEAACPLVCPLCSLSVTSRAQLGEHCVAAHGRGSTPPLLCPACFSPHDSSEALSAHVIHHRQQRHFVCGYGDCVLRFPTRGTLLSHIRRAHAGTLPAPVLPSVHNTCQVCRTTFDSKTALQRHHCTGKPAELEQSVVEDGEVEEGETEEGEGEMGVVAGIDGEGAVMYVDGEVEADQDGVVEYLEVETLDDEEFDIKPQL